MGQPGYLTSFNNGSLEIKAQKAWDCLSSCRLCPRKCRINRLQGEVGFSRTGTRALVSSVAPHFGEESPLVGRGGSGTIFFAFCNLGCLFCQNYELSHGGEGVEISPETLARQMLHLQSLGCHNINWVTPTHVVPMLLKALLIAVPMGLHLPLVYNCGGYESLETLEWLDGVIDIYMPDFKFWDSAAARTLAQVEDYQTVACLALKAMHRQVDDLVLNEQGIAQRGLLLRHLVMPDRLGGTREIMSFVAREISPNTYVNIMDQYRPCGQAVKLPGLNRRIREEEYEEALKWAKEAGLLRLDEGSRQIRKRWL
jgi:putative pyruvate formate lyase activating enzyme